MWSVRFDDDDDYDDYDDDDDWRNNAFSTILRYPVGRCPIQESVFPSQVFLKTFVKVWTDRACWSFKEVCLNLFHIEVASLTKGWKP